MYCTRYDELSSQVSDWSKREQLACRILLDEPRLSVSYHLELCHHVCDNRYEVKLCASEQGRFRRHDRVGVWVAAFIGWTVFHVMACVFHHVFAQEAFCLHCTKCECSFIVNILYLFIRCLIAVLNSFPI